MTENMSSLLEKLSKCCSDIFHKNGQYPFCKSVEVKTHKGQAGFHFVLEGHNFTFPDVSLASLWHPKYTENEKYFIVVNINEHGFELLGKGARQIMSNYKKLWIDDQCFDMHLVDRHAPPGYVPLDSVKTAQEWVLKNGMPTHLDLDHDLGEVDGEASTIMEFLRWLFEQFPDSPPPAYEVHSQNPIGRENIISFLDSWKRASEM